MIEGINVTPLVDVILVLLIVLMVTASGAVSKALPMELPHAKSGESENTTLAISIDEAGALFLDGVSKTEAELRALVRLARAKNEPSALIAADGRARHQQVVRVIDLLRTEGVTKFAINVAPDDLRRED
jgi:biopolymer transport protein ExbD